MSTGLNPSGAHVFSFLDGLAGLLVFFLRTAILGFGFTFEGPADVEGPGSVRVLSASSAEEDEMIIAFLEDVVAANNTLAEAALERGEVLEPIISWTISPVDMLLVEDWGVSLKRLGGMMESSPSVSLVEFSSASVLMGATVDSASIVQELKRGVV